VSYKEKNGATVINKIIDDGLLSQQIARTASFYSTYDTKNIIGAVRNAIEMGVSSTMYELNISQSENIKFQTRARQMPPEFFTVLFDSDGMEERTEEALTKKLVERFDYPELRAKKLIHQLWQDGVIIAPDKVHFELRHEHRMVFKGD